MHGSEKIIYAGQRAISRFGVRPAVEIRRFLDGLYHAWDSAKFTTKYWVLNGVGAGGDFAAVPEKPLASRNVGFEILDSVAVGDFACGLPTFCRAYGCFLDGLLAPQTPSARFSPCNPRKMLRIFPLL